MQVVQGLAGFCNSSLDLLRDFASFTVLSIRVRWAFLDFNMCAHIYIYMCIYIEIHIRPQDQ